MREWLGKFLASPLGSWVRVFVVVVGGFWLADIRNAGYFHIDLSEWAPWLWAGVLAVVPVIVAWFNTYDPRFGRTKAS